MRFRSFICLAIILAAGPAFGQAPVKLIFDTDMGNDVDDALALGMIHALQSRGACELLAVTLTNPDPLAGRYIDAINTFYGRGDVPIGVNPAAPRAGSSAFLKLADARDAAGALVFPHDFNPNTAQRAIDVLRHTLAGADDQSVVIVQVGFFTNLAALLDSAPDAAGALDGRDLVARKVRLLSVMAGAFQTVNGDNHRLEFNVRIDIPHAQQVAERWPTAVVWSGWEIGNAITFPAATIEHDFAWTRRHPIPEAYQLYRPTPHERPCWDPTSVLAAVYPARGYFGVSIAGRVTIEPDGFTRFVPAKNPTDAGRDRFLLVEREQIARARELISVLVSEPPVRGAANFSTR